MLITPAHAASGGTGGFDVMGLVPFALIAVIFYFFLIRPQNKKLQEHKEMVNSITRGDRVEVAGGILGQIDKVGHDNTLSIEVAKGVKITVFKDKVTRVLDKTFPLKLEALSGGEAVSKTTAKKAPAKSRAKKA